MRSAYVLALLAALQAITLNGWGQDPPAQTGTIRGIVRDAEKKPVSDALVVLCDLATGLPIGKETHAPFISQPQDQQHPAFDEWLFVRTDESGRFVFAEVPAAGYRLIAQSWPRVPEPKGPLEVNGLTVQLRGIADSVVVPSESAEAVTIEPLGDGTFVYTRGAGNDDWYIFLSTGPLLADPVLGPLGWKGPFLQQAIGYGRMPGAQLIVQGLPEKEVHFAIFANDSRPGFGAGSFRARAGQLVAHDTNLVVGWSDGIHAPPKHLAPLTEEVREFMDAHGGPGGVERLLAKGREDAWSQRSHTPGFAAIFDAADILGPLDRQIELPSGTRATVAEIMAAAAYVRMQSTAAR